MTSHLTRQKAAEKRLAAIGAMISSLRRNEDRHYYLGLVRYYIDGTPYSASGLTVDLECTLDLRETDVGLSCTAMFPPNILDPRTVKANGTIKINLGGEIREVTRVRLEVVLDDIWSVAEFIDGIQHDLFCDAEMLKLGLEAFANKGQ